MRTSLCPYELKNNSNADIVLQWASPPHGILASRINVTGVSSGFHWFDNVHPGRQQMLLVSST